MSNVIHTTPAQATRWQNLCIEELADSEYMLRQDAASLRSDVAVYRALAQTALAKVADLTKAVDRLTERNRALVSENAELAAELQTLRRGTRDAA